MAASSTTVEVSFRKLAESLRVACEELKENHSSSNAQENLSTNEFWTIFTETSRLLSQESTKLCMLFSKPPKPTKDETRTLVSNLERACLAVLATFNRLPVERGKTLHGSVKHVVLSMLEAVCTLCLELDRSGPAQLTSTANIWEKCDMVKELPRDNREAALQMLKRDIELVDDALSEFEESIENPTDNFHDDLVEELESRNGVNLHQKENWELSENDRLLLPPSRGLVKAAKAVLKKTTTCVNRNRPLEEVDPSPVDDLVDLAAKTSALVDDFILSTYPPLSHTHLGTQATNLSVHLKDILKKAQSSYLVDESDQNWIEFLSRAVDHNLRKINELL